MNISHEILIADAQVKDLDVLLSGLAPNVDAWLIQPGEDAMTSVFKALAMPGLSKLHLLAHGAPGEIRLGGRAITATDFRSCFDGAAVRDLDIAFWSCQTGAGEAGQAFVQAVAEATGARVVAAEGLVGSAAKNGSWELDVKAPFTDDAMGAFGGVLTARSGTAANLAAGTYDGTLPWVVADDLTVTDTATVQQLFDISAGTNITSPGAPNALITTVTDTAAAIAGSNNAALTAFAGIGIVTANTAASASEATVIAAFAKAVVYGVTDTATALAGAAGAALNEATTITATTVASVAEAATIEAATNSGANTYDMSDTAAALAASSNAVLTLAGTVTASDAATVAQATTLSGFTKAVVYGVTGTAAALAGAAGAALNEATTITATTAASVAEATTIEAATNSGANTYDISDTAVALAASSNAVLTLATTVTATGNATAAQATTIAAFAKAVVYSISDTAAALAGTSAGGLNEAASITVTAGSAAATDLNTIDTVTTVAVDAALVSTLTGTAATIITAYGSSGITGLGDETVTVSGATSAANAQSIFTATTGTVTVGLVNSYTTGSAFTVAAGDVINIDPSSAVTALGGTAQANVGAVDAAGEWFFDTATKLFTWRDTGNNTTDSMTLSGAASVTVSGDLVTIDPIDITPPVFASATVSGSTLVLTYTDVGNLDAAHPPLVGDFDVYVNGGSPVTPTVVSVNAIAKTVTLTLPTAVYRSQYVDVSYTDPTGNDDTDAIQDAAGNDAGSMWTQVTNITPTFLSAPNTYVIETPATPYFNVPEGMVAQVIDAAGAQDFFIYTGGKLELTGVDGANTIYMYEYNRSDLTVSRSGATAIFKHGSEEIARISAPTGSSQTIYFADYSSHTLANNGALVTLGSQTLTTSFLAIADTTAPTLSWSSPYDDNTMVGSDNNIELHFSEAVQAGTGNITISNGSGDTRTIAVTDTSQVTFNGSSVTINPTLDLAANTTYYVQVAGTAIKDLAATPNSYAGITDTTTLNFTTGPAAGTVVTGGGDDTIYGSNSSDTITTNGGADTITAYGGTNILLGGVGADTFVFRNLNQDAATWLSLQTTSIADYGTGGQNTHALANAAISGLNGDVLMFDYSDLAGLTGFAASTNFVVTVNIPTGTNGTTGGSAIIAQGAGTVAATAAHAQFIYNSTDGVLRFDADGTGSSATVIVVGTLSTGDTLTATDFLFVA
ncbi:MAG: DUF4347 domain-containing protein [Methylovulum sp.]|nr:DUF4347 domain-containing protein [Methylovulum sp.]